MKIQYDRFGDQTQEGWLGAGKEWTNGFQRVVKNCAYRPGSACQQGDCGNCIYNEDDWNGTEDKNGAKY